MARLPEFRKKLRKLQDKKKISNRELLGLFFDLHEMLSAIGEEARREMEMMDMMGPPSVFKIPDGVSPEEFFSKVVKSERGRKKKEPEEKPPPKGQYL